jgi:hypothetical protein
VFDQHNGLSPEQRKIFPFKIIERTLPSSGKWIVVSASGKQRILFEDSQ